MTHSVTCIVILSGIITVLYYVYFIFDVNYYQCHY